ncbi:MAG: hypothetical protein Q8R40_00740 [bacterium]|nr:hypothetical protein [bacterium]
MPQSEDMPELEEEIKNIAPEEEHQEGGGAIPEQVKETSGMTFEQQDEMVAESLGQEKDILEATGKKAEGLDPERRKSVLKKLGVFGLTSFIAANIAFAAVPQESEARGRHQQGRGPSAGAIIGGTIALIGLGTVSAVLQDREMQRRAAIEAVHRAQAEAYAKAERERIREERREERRDRAEERRENRKDRAIEREERSSERGSKQKSPEDIIAVNKMSPQVRMQLAQERARGDYIQGGKMVIKDGYPRDYLDTYVSTFIQLSQAGK